MRNKIKFIGIFLLTIGSFIFNQKQVKAEITVANNNTDYVVYNTSRVYNSRLKRVDFKTRGKMRGQSVPVAEPLLYEGKFVNVYGRKTIKGQEFYQIGRNEYIKKANVISYSQTKAELASQDENDWNDDLINRSFVINSIDEGDYNVDPSPNYFDDSSYKNRMINNARHLLGYFRYGSGGLRTSYGNWRHPRKHGRTDCSGFVWLVMKKSGARVGNWPFFTMPMENDAKRSHRYLRRISAKSIRPGDVVIVNVKNGLGNNGHAAIVDGKYDGWDTQIIEMGGDSNGPVHRSTLGGSLSYALAHGRVTYARKR